MDTILLLLHVMWGAIASVLRRTIRGPRHTGWSWAMEASVGAMRASFAQIAPLGAIRYRAASNALAPMVTAGVPCREVVDGPLAGHWLEPPDAEDRVIVYAHGGGFIFGSIRSHGNLAGHLAQAAGARVLVPTYPLAPEHPLPAAIEHLAAAIVALVDEGVDPSRIVLAGDSAGGNLVFTVLMALRDRGGPRLAGGFAISPWTDLTNSGDSFERWHDVDYCTLEACAESARCALGDSDGSDPTLSPLHAGLRDLPRILVHAGGAECLQDQIVALGQRAREQGADVEVVDEEGMVHVWHMLVGTVPQAGRSIEQAAAWIRSLTPAGPQ